MKHDRFALAVAFIFAFGIGRSLSNTYPSEPMSTSEWTVYVVDSGIDSSEIDNVTFGYDAFNGNGQPSGSHGTDMAKIIQYYAPGVHFVNVKIWNNTNVHVPGFVKAIDWISKNASPNSVVLLAWAIPGVHQDLVESVRALTTKAHVVAAAGNDGIDVCEGLLTPQSFVPELIIVGAKDPFDRKAPWSNRGICIDAWEVGEHRHNILEFAQGTSIAAARYTGKLIARLSQN